MAVAWSRRRNLELVTTEFVLVELGDAFSGPGARDEFAIFQDALRGDSACKILPASPGLFQSGLEIFRKRRDKSWQLTDCISFAAMERGGIRAVLTGDHHFEQAGFTALLSNRSGSF